MKYRTVRVPMPLKPFDFRALTAALMVPPAQRTDRERRVLADSLSLHRYERVRVPIT